MLELVQQHAAVFGRVLRTANHVRGCNGLCSTEKLSRSYPGRENQGKDQDETLDDEGVVQYGRAR